MKKSSNPQFTLEQEVLLWAIRVDHTKDQRIAEILENGVNWTYIRQTAIQHGIIPILYRRLLTEMDSFIPSDEMKKLRLLFLENAAKNLRMTKELLKVLDLLADAGIESMPFKGPVLTMQAYGDLSMRCFCDLDILIHRNDFFRAYDVLTNGGCSPQYPLNMPAKKKIALMKKDFIFSSNALTFELHWNFTERFWTVSLDMDSFWDRSVFLSVKRQQVRTLSVEDTFFILSIHGAKHSFQELKWLIDIICILSRQSEIKMEELISRSEKLGVKRIILLNLHLARDFGGVLLKPEINIILDSNPEVQAIARGIPEHLFHSQNVIFHIFTPFFYMKYRERLGDKLKFLSYYLTDVLLLPTREDYQVAALPNLLFPVYFFIRPIRGILEYGKELSESFL